MPRAAHWVHANSRDSDLWLSPGWGPFPDRFEGQIAMGDATELDGVPPRLIRANRGRRVGDMLWTTGSFVKVASTRLIAAFRDLGATGFETFDVDVDHPLVEPGSFVGLAITGTRGTDSLYPIHEDGPFDTFAMQPELLDGLRETGIDKFQVEDPSW